MTLEILLNRLVTLGWNPWGYPFSLKEPINATLRVVEDGDYIIYSYTQNDALYGKYSIRDLVSLESGLWQFVCEKGLYNYDNIYSIDMMRSNYRDSVVIGYQKEDYRYRIMLSSIQEDIPQFLLDNIKID